MLVTISLILLLLLCMGSPPLPSAPTEVGVKPPSVTMFFQADDIANSVPLPPASYPENLRGIFWLDAFGYYGSSDLPGGFEDGVISFGDTTFAELDTENHQILVSTSGAGWTWFNNAQAYEEYDETARTGNYLFAWNANYTYARIWPSFHDNGRNWYGLGPQVWSWPLLFVQFTIEKQTPPEGATCPPAANATREERSACAAWVRTSCTLWCFGSRFGFNKPSKYYVYEVVDANGSKVDPYFSAFVDFAATRADPDSAAAEKYNINLSGGGLENTTIFHATYIP